MTKSERTLSKITRSIGTGNYSSARGYFRLLEKQVRREERAAKAELAAAK